MEESGEILLGAREKKQRKKAHTFQMRRRVTE